MTTALNRGLRPNTPDETARMAEEYKASEQTIIAAVGAFVARYGGHFDELVAEADHAFFICSQRGEIDDIYRWVFYELLDTYRRDLTKSQTLKFMDLQEDVHAETELPPAYDDLGSDAEICVQLALNPPPCLRARAERKGGTPRNYKSTIREHLQACGWSSARITNAFEEVKAA